MVDTSSIHRLIGSARRRLKMQAALEWATTASIAASRLGARNRAGRSPGLGRRVQRRAPAHRGCRPGRRRRCRRGHASLYSKLHRHQARSQRQSIRSPRQRRVRSKPSFTGPGADKIDAETQAMMRLAMLDATRRSARQIPRPATPFSQTSRVQGRPRLCRDRRAGGRYTAQPRRQAADSRSAHTGRRSRRLRDRGDRATTTHPHLGLRHRWSSSAKGKPPSSPASRI